MKSRNVKTAFFDDNYTVQQTNRSTDPNKASINAYAHLMYNTYGNWNVRVAHVFEAETGELYSEVIRVMEGDQVGIYTTYKKGDPAIQYPKAARKKDIPVGETVRSPAVLLIKP